MREPAGACARSFTPSPPYSGERVGVRGDAQRAHQRFNRRTESQSHAYRPPPSFASAGLSLMREMDEMNDAWIWRGTEPCERGSPLVVTAEPNWPRAG